MADTVTIHGKEWDVSGLPAHMLADLPLTVEVTVTYPPTVTHEGVSIWHAGCIETYQVQLERGKPLTLADRRPSWVAGERDGWKAWPVRVPAEPGWEVEA